MDRSVALHSQTGLATPLISRFDIVLLLSDSQDPQRDQRLSSHILANTPSASGASAADGDGHSCAARACGVGSSTRARDDGSAGAATDGAAFTEDAWSLEKLRQYLEYVRVKLQPTLSEEAQRVLTGYYSMQRGAQDRDAARSTIRMLEALVRLAQAHARLMFRPECLVMDAVFAIMLMEGSYNSSRLLDHDFSVLKEEFVDDPDELYKTREYAILTGIGIDPADVGVGVDTGGRGYDGGGHEGRGGFDGGGFGGFGGGVDEPMGKRQRTPLDELPRVDEHLAGAPPVRTPGAPPPGFGGFA
jgi:DNA helicase MCM9